MQLITQDIPKEKNYPWLFPGYRREDAVFFDIETTGFSPRNAGLYLIGYLSFEGDAWRLTQLFADSMLDEIPMLNSFFSMLSQKKLLLSFNGDSFDLPFLSALIRRYALPYHFRNIESLDIFKEIRPAKKLLSLKNYKLKTIERFLGIAREDHYDGGQLIRIYQNYLEEKDAELRSLLLLHNAEDLMNLPLLLPMLNYPRLLTEDMQLTGHEILPLPSGDGRVLELHYRFALPLPAPLHIDRDSFCLSASDRELTLRLRLFQGELKFFYENYQDYYYLPAEDMAVHKSVGVFVDRNHRKKATGSTAYLRKKGVFLSQPSVIFTPAFQHTRKDTWSFTELTASLFRTPEKWDRLLKAYLNSLH